MFEGWSDEIFAAWLAGYFDGEGCVFLPKSGVGIDVSIASTDRPVIEAIHRRTGVGIVTETVYANEAWKTKYSWACRNYPHAAVVLRMMRPYLTIKAERADEALRRIDAKLSVREQRYNRYLEIVQLIEAGVVRTEIAKQFGICRQMVDTIYRNRPGQAADPLRTVDFTWMRKNVQQHKKVKAVPSTMTVNKSARWHRMSEDRVREIRTLLTSGSLVTELAERFGVTRQTIRDIGSRKSWAHVV